MLSGLVHIMSFNTPAVCRNTVEIPSLGGGGAIY
jgi:hypothetical protein